jgi:hypothetical protein
MALTLAIPLEQFLLVGRPLIIWAEEKVQVAAFCTTAVNVSQPLVVTTEGRLAVNEEITGTEVAALDNGAGPKSESPPDMTAIAAAIRVNLDLKITLPLCRTPRSRSKDRSNDCRTSSTCQAKCK